MLYVPMLLAISLHTHTEATDTEGACAECLHHVCHESHFAQKSFVMDDCVLCQFYSAPYLVPSILSFTCYSTDIHTPLATSVALLPTAVVSLHSPRAPPTKEI